MQALRQHLHAGFPDIAEPCVGRPIRAGPDLSSTERTVEVANRLPEERLWCAGLDSRAPGPGLTDHVFGKPLFGHILLIARLERQLHQGHITQEEHNRLEGCTWTECQPQEIWSIVGLELALHLRRHVEHGMSAGERHPVEEQCGCQTHVRRIRSEVSSGAP